MANKAKCQFCDFDLREEDFYCPACGEPVMDYDYELMPQGKARLKKQKERYHSG